MKRDMGRGRKPGRKRRGISGEEQTIESRSSTPGPRRFELLNFADAAALAAAAADAWLGKIAGAKDAGETHCVALSGGRIAQRFFAAVVERVKETLKAEGDHQRSKLELCAPASGMGRVHFFWGDERCVPPDDPDSNYRMAREFLLGPLGIAEERIHRIRGEARPEIAARSAAEDLCRQCNRNAAGWPVLDLVFLGMGEEGHVASLFPGEPKVVMAGTDLYRPVIASKPPPRRITLGYGPIMAAREVWVLASGTGKDKALRESIETRGNTPLARVLKLRSETKILTDLTTAA
jgi:6-phosphogluconolactonase